MKKRIGEMLVDLFLINFIFICVVGLIGFIVEVAGSPAYRTWFTVGEVALLLEIVLCFVCTGTESWRE